MSDLIDRQEAIEHCKKRLLESAYNNVQVVCDVSYTMQEIADNRIENWLKELPSGQQWIPCSERLPEYYCEVIVTVKEKYEYEKEYRYYTDIAEHLEGDDWCTFNDWDEGQDVEIVAWMPLPEPWKGEELDGQL